MGRTACTEPQCLYKGALYLYLYCINNYGERWKNKTVGAENYKIARVKCKLHRNFHVEKVEQLLTVWVDDLNPKIIPLAHRAIAAKARIILEEIPRKEGGNGTFNASRGWFTKFKQHSQIHCIQISGEAASAHIEATRAFTAEFKKAIGDDDSSPDLFFNVDETGLYWKKLPSRTYVGESKIMRTIGTCFAVGYTAGWAWQNTSSTIVVQV